VILGQQRDALEFVIESRDSSLTEGALGTRSPSQEATGRFPLPILYGTATSGCEQLPKVSRSSLVDGRILVENPVFKDRRDVAGGGRPR
jgi:hypothetical protein